jgi:hypothetical protein
MASARKRCSETDRVSEILTSHAEVPDFLVYPEGIGLPQDRPKIEKNKELIVAVYSEFPSLSWTQSAMKTIMGDVATAKASEWPRALRDNELDEYKTRMALRIRTLFRHVKQAEKKKSSWILDLLGHAGGPGIEEAVEVEASGEGDDDEEDDAADELADDQDDDPKHPPGNRNVQN